MKNKYVDSDLNDFLKEEGILAECELVAIKRIIALEIQRNIDEHKMTKTALAHQIGNSRAVVDRLLNPENLAITLPILMRAAQAVGKKLQFSLI